MKTEILKRTLTSVNGRNGYITSKDSNLRLELTIPKEMGGTGNVSKTDPEELFAAGYSSCFSSSMQYMMQQENINGKDFYAEVTVQLLKDDVVGGYKFAATVKASIADVDDELKKKIIEKAYAFCPYSRAIKDNVDVKIVIV